MECILYERIPVPIARQLMLTGSVEPDSPKNVSVMFVDICNLKKTIENASPEQIVQLLNGVFWSQDELFDTTTRNVHKLDTIGDKTIVVSGVCHRVVSG